MNEKTKKSFDGKALLKKIGGLAGEYNYIIIFLCLFCVYWSLVDGMTGMTIMNIFRHSAIVGVLALGMGLIIITGGIDLSMGSMMALTAGLGIDVFNATDSISMTILFCLVFATFCGLVNGLLIGKAHMPPFIVTLATMLMFRSLLKFILTLGTKRSSYSMNNTDAYQLLKSFGDGEIFESLFEGSNFGNWMMPNIGLVLIVITIIIVYVATSTKYGKSVYALGSNEKAAKLAGIKGDWVRVSVYALAGFLIGVASFLWIASQRSVSTTAGTSYEMYAIAAVVIGGISMSGGKGKVLGIFFGAMSYTVIDKIITAIPDLDATINDTVKGAILLVAVAIQLAIPTIKTFIANLNRQRQLKAAAANSQEEVVEAEVEPTEAE